MPYMLVTFILYLIGAVIAFGNSVAIALLIELTLFFR